jgi:hypothetical protein
LVVLAATGRGFDRDLIDVSDALRLPSAVMVQNLKHGCDTTDVTSHSVSANPAIGQCSYQLSAISQSSGDRLSALLQII